MTVRPVEITVADGEILRGQIWPGDTYWVILLHDVGLDHDLDTWRPLLPSLASQSSTLLAIDLRGHGASDGSWAAETAVDDAMGIVSFARANGAVGVTLVAAGISAVTVLRVAASGRVDGLVLFSTAVVPPAMAMELRAEGAAKLFVVGSDDRAVAQTTNRLRKASIGWALAVSLPTDGQGSALLSGPWAGQIRDHVLGFVRERRYLTHGTVTGARQQVAEPAISQRPGVKTS